MESRRVPPESSSQVTQVAPGTIKPGYRRYQIMSAAGIDDFAATREVFTRRLMGLQERHEPFPDIWLIDGGKSQLSSALAAFESLSVVPPTVIALAKREEVIYVQGMCRRIRPDS
jgi:excinuclease ABC subunit C